MQKYGQHFLVNKGIINKIIDTTIDNLSGTLIEIGPGEGALTFPLTERGISDFTVIEIDPIMVQKLKKTLPAWANIKIIEGNFLELDLQFLEKEEKLNFVSNLPYIDAAQILLKVLELQNFASAVFMFQREQAQKLYALPESKHYGALSVLFQALAQSRPVCRVSPGSFNPPPKVESEVLFITPRTQKIFSNKTHYNNFKETVKTAFSYRRKTVLNALVEKYKKDKTALAKILVSSGLKVSSRAEEVPAKNYALLAKNLEGFIF
ncbi:MAG: 16S rRNA (adenine(1518)-N(6)/adenine(1519)-N(6))-dimethyltransferase RsmA [Elusimicrobiaceae bacterium]|nr:16S rRNA (adenine(1518)-N(6)/adenine(1519)-N(6))-dimethyltransferase RsmA [Elusimicrobiaceae bacterium]